MLVRSNFRGFFLALTGLFLAGSLFAQERDKERAQEAKAVRPASETRHEGGVVHRVILIGDAGRLLNGRAIVPEAAAKLIDPADSNVTVVFLGDNVYDKGLPAQEDENYAESIYILQQQLEPFDGYKAAIYMTPGNHDWQRGGPRGWERVKRQAAWVDSLPGEDIVFLPKGGCPGPEEIALSDSIVLVLVDTQWWLHPFDKPGEESDCECKTREEVVAVLQDIAWRNRDKKIIFAAHHAFRSHGIHGGYYTLKQHIFPFTDLHRSWYIPLPLLGSIYPLSRGVFGDIQDLNHPEYRYMVNSMEEAMEAAHDVTWAGGHDHSLQLIRDGKRFYIVSGSGINMERVKTASNSLFASGKRGFAELRFLEDGRKEVRFYEVDDAGNASLAFVKELQAPAEQAESTEELPAAEQLADREAHRPAESIPSAAPAPAAAAGSADSITIAIAPGYDEAGKTHRFFFGENYRKLWATPVKMRIFRLEEEMGGLEIVKKGGGQQTLSLRLADSTGKEWNLRTVQKDPEKALPPKLRATVARKIVQDQISAAHPFGALAVPPLAAALDIPHASPELVYLPADTALGMYLRDFAGAVYTFEEREPIPDDTKSTTTVLEKLEEDNDHVVDEKALLKARLLDLLIGDWDRHEDQWRWGKRDKEHGNVYFPIPRDRDQVFFTNSGLFPGIAARKWAMPKFQGFKAEIRDVNGFMYNARHFDRLFLHRLEEHDWKETASLVRETMTDQLLDSALRKMPDTIYRLSGQGILEILKARRDHLQEDALTYYRFLARVVDIPGSGQPDLFQVSLEENGIVRVRGSKVEKRERVFYERTFDPATTKEIRIYGRDDEDVFSVGGSGRTSIKIRMIGGADSDLFRVGEEVQDRGSLVIYDRSDLENTYPERGRAVFRTSGKPEVNEYDPQSFQYDRLMPLLTGGFNLDDGIFLGAGFQYVHHGFRKEPYASRNRLMIGHALATSAWFLNYEGEFIKLLGNTDLLANLEARAPHNTTNFFGAGNETVFREAMSDPAIQYYRTRYNLVKGDARLRFPLGNSFRLFAGLSGEYFNMRRDENEGRFIRDYALEHPQEAFFSHRVFAGLTGGFEIDTRNHPMVPTRGLFWTTAFKGMQQVEGEKDHYAQLQTELRLFTSFNLDPRLVIANRIGAGYTFGDPEFYQLLYLGGKENLRGYRNFRFAGEGMCYHNIELRVKLFDFTSYLFPGSVGLTGFHDIGRVWRPGEDSGEWHRGYGAGVYVVPAEMLVLRGSVGFSEEETLPSVSVGFQF